MAVTTVVNETGVHVRLTGWESVFGFARRVDIDADQVGSAQRMRWDEVREHFGRRLGSAYLPRGRAGGWFLVTKGRQHLVWCWLDRGEPALVVRTNRFRPGQIAVAASTVTYADGSEWFTRRVT
ncbi:MAG: hypothetical protein F2737_00990 [Actinobacteria bacterium]|jgi:hypothetical protein|uniref:Unannotated protein n=1 Tax=freshwater metagenome TaxID=449393 RepID=A0A6J6X0U3_9ZZZZ|nr:hypothetical protein [Actinomycetota bacterium]